MRDFDFIDLLLFLGISQGVFLSITLQLIQKKNRPANSILSLILVMSAIIMLGRLYYYNYEHIEFFARLTMLVDGIIFLFGPLLYVYVRRIIFTSREIIVLKWYEFIPSFLHLIFAFWTFSYSIEELQVLYQQSFFVIPFFTTELVSVLMLIFYTIKCFLVLKKFRLAEEKILSFHQEIYYYLMTLIAVFLLVSFFWLLIFLRSYYVNEYSPYFNYNIVWFLIPVIMYVVGFYSLRQPEIFRVPILKPKKLTGKKRLSEEKVKMLSSQLEKLLVVDKVYLDPHLTLAHLAAQLDTSANDLSWLLNQIHQCSFYDYINRYRVDEFIAKIKQREHERHTILALSLDAGFNSKSTFNKAFKTVVNDTPTNYIKKLATA